jgi:hypothetical protein
MVACRMACLFWCRAAHGYVRYSVSRDDDLRRSPKRHLEPGGGPGAGVKVAVARSLFSAPANV